MAINRGKIFEERIKSDWLKTVPDSFILRIPDQMTGYKVTSKNICDFIAYKKPNCFLIECKSTHENTLSFSAVPQYDRLLPYKNISGVFAGIMVWWVNKQEVAWIPIETAEQLVNEGKKSINIKILDDPNYKTLRIRHVKKRLYVECDLSCLIEMEENNER